jgi:dTDP-4-dehydrorhamnose 3,5-epimerase
MIFTETPLKGAYVVEVQQLRDERGFFGRSWCKNEFAEHGLNPAIAQSNISLNYVKGTVRGMHYQIAPFREAKVVRCTRGSIFDVIIDLRRESETFMKWFGIELSSENYSMLYVPERFAHGFQTLQDQSEVFYEISQIYSASHARGVRWDDPHFDIHWPLEISTISEKDRLYPDLNVSSLP